MIDSVTGNYDTFICLGLFTYLTKLQPQRNADVINRSMIIFSLGYLVLKNTRLLHPSKQLEPHIEAEWRSRIIGFVHAVILTIGSLLCFSEWIYTYRGDEGWVVRDEKVYYYPEFFASIFAGYLQYDFIWLLKNREKCFDPAALIHHILYIPITHYVLWGRFFCRPFAWLSFGELSTPFLHLRWFYLTLGMKQSKQYVRVSILFALSFLLTRVIGYGLGLTDIWLSRDAWVGLPKGLYAVIVGVHLGFLLNLFWAKKVIYGLVKQAKKH